MLAFAFILLYIAITSAIAGVSLEPGTTAHKIVGIVGIVCSIVSFIIVVFIL